MTTLNVLRDLLTLLFCLIPPGKYTPGSVTLAAAQTQEVTMPPPNGDFSCTRPTTTCVGGGSSCNDFTRQCLCPDGITGLQCTVPKEDVNQGSCQVAGACAPNRALCWDASGGIEAPTCSCFDGFYGNRCEHKMVQTECDSENMVINIFPYGFDRRTWSSMLTPALETATKSCPMQTVSDFVTKTDPSYAAKGWDGFAAMFSHVGDLCAGDATVVSTNSTSKTYSRDIFVGYTPTGPHHTDQLITASCTVSTPAPTSTATPSTTTTTTLPTTTTTQKQTTPPRTPKPTTTTVKTTTTTRTTTPTTMTTTTTTTTKPTTKPTTSPRLTTPRLKVTSTSGAAQRTSSGTTTSKSPGQLSPNYPGKRRPVVRVVMTGEDRRPIRGNVKLGSLVRVTFTVDPNNNKGITDLRVDRCTVIDSVSLEEVVVVENTCVRRPMGLLLNSKGEGHWDLVVKIFKFSTSVHLNFRCSVKLCRYRDPSCGLATNCFFRFRRSTSSDVQAIGLTEEVETNLVGYV